MTHPSFALPLAPALARAFARALALSLGVAAASCGGGDITFGGGDGDNAKKVTFRGNLDQVSPVTSRDIVAFVYSVDEDGDLCPCPGDPSASTVGKAVVLDSGETEFTVSGLEPGAFGVVFLLDKAGDQADGQIDAGDDIAILDDVDCQLDDVAGGLTVNLDDVDLAFAAAPATECRDGVSDPPAQGRARADLIRLATSTDDSEE